MTNRPPKSDDGIALDAAAVELDTAGDDEGYELRAGKFSRGHFLFGFVACADGAVATVGRNVAPGPGFG